MRLLESDASLHFATPIFRGKFEGTSSLNGNLKSFFLEYERKNKGNTSPKNTTLGPIFDSTADLFNWDNNAVQQLRGMMHSVLSAWIKDVNSFSAEQFQQLKFRYESWFHITRKGGCKTLHNHAPFSWSMVYYVDEGGEAPAEFPKSGLIQFYDPRRVSTNAWDVGLQGLNPQTQVGGFSIQPKAGTFVIFPSYLDHEVLTYHGDSQRMMVALNCSIVTPDAPKI
jgi:uncharacterized protein (TIGR02466 family)